MIQYVKNNAETVDLNIEKKNENADVQVEYDGKHITMEEYSS